MAGGDHEFDGATVRRLTHVRNSNLSRLLVDVQLLNQFGRLNIHRQLRNNMNPISTTRPFRGRMYTVSVGFEKKRAARGYIRHSRICLVPRSFPFCPCASQFTMVRLKVCSRNSCVSVLSFFLIYWAAPDCDWLRHRRRDSTGMTTSARTGKAKFRADDSMAVALRTAFTISNNSSMVKGFSSVAANCRRGFWPDSSVGNDAEARMTGSFMCAERSFRTSSTPVSFGILLSVIKRS